MRKIRNVRRFIIAFAILVICVFTNVVLLVIQYLADRDIPFYARMYDISAFVVLACMVVMATSYRDFMDYLNE